MTINQLIKYAEKNNISLNDEVLIASPSIDDNSPKRKNTDKVPAVIGHFRQIGSHKDSFLAPNNAIVLITNCFPELDLSESGVRNIVNDANFDNELMSARFKPESIIAKEYEGYMKTYFQEYLKSVGYSSDKSQANIFNCIERLCKRHTNQEYTNWNDSFVIDIIRSLMEIGISKPDIDSAIQSFGN